MLCLMCWLSVQDERPKAAHDRALSHDGGFMCFMLAIEFVA
jgi:hypothetical protein